MSVAFVPKSPIDRGESYLTQLLALINISLVVDGDYFAQVLKLMSTSDESIRFSIISPAAQVLRLLYRLTLRLLSFQQNYQVNPTHGSLEPGQRLDIYGAHRLARLSSPLYHKL